MPKTVGGGWLSYVIFAARQRARRLFLGRPLETSVQLEHRLPIYLAIPVFASDAISSVAYGTEEILVVLAVVSVGAGSATGYLIPISLAIAVLMIVVTTSYRRAVHLYPTSGGSYTVAKSNLGSMAGLVAGSALLIDYIMTVAVSVSSGVDALTSAFSALLPAKILIALLLVAFMTLINLRGARESGWWFALPMYTFAATVGLMVVCSVVHWLTGTVQPVPPPDRAITPSPTIALGLFVILRAFSHGCTSLTGVEAVSNGVNAFQPPEAKNAARTLAIMLVTLLFLFLGTSLAARLYHVVPATEGATVLSQLGQANFGRSILYYILQFATTAILMVAANTSFAGFPRLLAFMAKDEYAPKAFVSLGDRLVFTRGIMALAVISGVLIVLFRANVTALLGLYAVGVFICFTLTQLGMAKKLREMRQKGWLQSVAINYGGAAVTGAVAVVTLITKFTQGAALVMVLIPVLILIAVAIKRHYEWFYETMSLGPRDYNPLRDPTEALTVLVLVSSDIHRGILEGLECGRAIANGRPDNILRAVHIEIDPEKTERLKRRWAEFVVPYMGEKIRLDIISSPYRWLLEPIMEYIDKTDIERVDDRLIVVLPEFETGSVITHFLHNFTARRLRALLMNRPHVTVVSSRYFMKTIAWRLGRGGLVY